MNDRVAMPLAEAALEADELGRMLEARAAPTPQSAPIANANSPAGTTINGVVIGTLLGFIEGRTPIVIYPDQPGSAAIASRTMVALNTRDIGNEVVLQFEAGDPKRPIILGRVQAPEAWPLDEQPAQVQVDADGKRLVVDAKEEITLRCGKASITLTKAGKVLIQGAYVLHRSSGVMRIKGGSVQLN